MKEKIIILLIITIYSKISTPLIKNNIPNSLNFSESSIQIAIADDIWDYLSRFRVNN